jgi:hypothetical protein
MAEDIELSLGIWDYSGEKAESDSALYKKWESSIDTAPDESLICLCVLLTNQHSAFKRVKERG